MSIVYNRLSAVCINEVSQWMRPLPTFSGVFSSVSQEGVQRTLREEIVDRIRLDILSGQFESGTSLPEVLLAKRYGVSRAPIRDALLRLTQEGLLDARPNCGVKVGSRANERLQPLVVELRRTIEESALRIAFHKLTTSDLDELENSVEGLREACETRNLKAVALHDISFHRQLVSLANSAELVAIWLPIVSRMMLHYERHRDLNESFSEHSEILDAIRTGDQEAAVKALRTNIQ